jgi:hypothetical protein
MKIILFFFILASSTVAGGAPRAPASEPYHCDCTARYSNRSIASTCGTEPAFMRQDQTEIARQLGFEVPEDDRHPTDAPQGKDLYHALAKFLVNSGHGRVFYPEYYTRATQDASVLTLKSEFIPKKPAEVDDYFRCTIPQDKYCLFKNKLRPYIGLAAKASGIDYSFLACQSYVESRFNPQSTSSVGALGYAQIQPSTLEHINTILKKSIRESETRSIANIYNEKDAKINRAHKEIAQLWREFWKGTARAPKTMCKNDLTCYRQVFLAQALALKTDMLALAVSKSGLHIHYDDAGDFRIENMDKGDSLLLLAGSYNLGVTKTIRLVSRNCSGASKLKECLERMQNSGENKKDIRALTNYVMRIRDCSQQYSAEQLDFNDDERWSTSERTEKQNQQRDRVTSCLLAPCPYKIEPR